LADDFFGHAQYRFCQNSKISMQTLLEAHREAVIGRMRAHPGTQGLGPMGTKLEAGPIGPVLQFAAMLKAAHQPSIAVH
jgi:hypothetical protein